MFGRISHFLTAAQSVLGVAAVWPDAGYLPHIGPVALRFRVQAAPVVERVNSPVPPPPPEPIFLAPPPMPPPSKPKEPTNAPAAVQSVTNAPPVEFNAREPITDPAPAMVPEGVISPQMLIKYFATPTNAASTNAAGVVAPVDFTPPGAGPPPVFPSSSKDASSTSP